MAGHSASNGFVAARPNLNPALNRNPDGWWNRKITMTIKIKSPRRFVTAENYETACASFTM
jgi:hypothetical protein